MVLSGGQDSTTCLYWAIRRFDQSHVVALTFDYGQRHEVEVDCARNIAAHAGIEHHVLPINTFADLAGNALLDTGMPIDGGSESTLPNTFVPGRNLIFLTFAAAFAWPRGITDMVTGVAQTDFSGYPDCREETILSLQETLRLGMQRRFTIHTPLMHLTKRETVLLADQLGALDAMAMTITCYNGEQPPCGDCPACVLRARGFADAGLRDPLVDK